MKNLLKAEFYYLFKNIRYYIFILLIVAGYVTAFITKNTLLPAVMSLVAIIFSAVIILEFSHKDFKNKTMKNYVGCGIPLGKVYFAKLIVCLCAVFIMLTISGIMNDFAKLACGMITESDVEPIGIIVGILTYLIESTVVFFFCSFIRSGVLSILVAIAYTCVCPLIFTFVHNDFLDAIGPFFSFSIQSQLNGEDALGAAVQGATAGFTPEIALHLGVSILVTIALTCLGSYLYSKREIK